MVTCVLKCTLTIKFDFNESLVRLEMNKKLKRLDSKIQKSILIHVHIPKAGGTALALALSSNCHCKTESEKSEDNSTYLRPTCDCPLIKGKNKKKYYYTVNRATGWIIGAHPPLAGLKYSFGDAPDSLRKNGIFPTFVIMLRDPYPRFVSEILRWTSRGRTCDWSVRKTLPNGEEKFHPSIIKNFSEKSDEALFEYCQLSKHLILHNRQTKMIGGKLADFNFHFDPVNDFGSRWNPKTRKKSSKPMQEAFERAKKVLVYDKESLIGLHERFEDSLCMLEILYGSLYKFNWDPDHHSHDKNKHIDKNNSMNLVNQLTGINNGNNPVSVNRTVYEEWFKKNKYDVDLYDFSKKVFEIQFQTAIDYMKMKMGNANTTVSLSKTKKRLPHCRVLLE